MALPGRVNVRADLHVSQNAARAIALQEAVRFSIGAGDNDPYIVMRCAEKFHRFLTTDGTQDETGDSE